MSDLPQDSDTPALSQLRIPFGLNEEGACVRPADAERSGCYFCPECGEALILRRGEIRVSHFAHYGDPNCRLAGERWMHVAAKYVLKDAIRRASEGAGPQVRLLRRCPICKSRKMQNVPARISEVEIEYKLKNGRVADLALFDSEQRLACVVEIRRSHEVDTRKQTDLEGLPWVELAAGEVLKNPQLWFPLKTNGLRKFRCLCEGATRMRTVRRTFGLHVPQCPLAVGLPPGQSHRNTVSDCRSCPFMRKICEIAGESAREVIVLCEGITSRGASRAAEIGPSGMSSRANR
ncbi:MAG: competence protein CoiA family protein [Candidatus Brocadiia bacterium]